MASPSTVLTRGLGTWGSVNTLPTLGYDTGVSYGPLSFPYHQVFVPGSRAAQVFTPGSITAQVFVPGSSNEQVEP